MSRLLFVYLTCFWCLSLSSQLLAQNPSIQDCIGAIPICQPIYEEDQSPSGMGNISEINGNFNCMQVELNSIWYTFTVNQTGDFGFLLTPNNINDDYDWALFDITNAECSDLFTDPSLIVSCNAAGGAGCVGPTGATGETNFDDQGFNCGSNPPDFNNGFSAFNSLIPVTAGNTYVLCVSNWSGSPNGYTIDFGLSSGIDIFDQEVPMLSSIEQPVDCEATQIGLNFSEPVKCNSLTNLNFSLEGPGGPYLLTLQSNSCLLGANLANDFSLQIFPPIIDQGDFVLSMLTDEMTMVLDKCDNPAPDTTFAFSTAGFLVNVELGPDTTLCAGDTVFLDATQLQNGAIYQWQDGSDTPTYTATSTDDYIVAVTSICGTKLDTISIVFQDALPQVDLGPDRYLCEGQPLLLDATTPGAVYVWQDSSFFSQYAVTEPGTYHVTISSDCGMNSDTVLVQDQDPIEASLDLISICQGESLTWDVTTEGAAYEWQDGSTESVFTADEVGNYQVVISTVCETQTLQANIIEVQNPPAIFIGTDTLLCPDANLELNVSTPGATYWWQDGSNSPFYTIEEAGDYQVIVQNGCGIDTANVSVEKSAPILINLPEDTIWCPGDIIELNAFDPNAEYYSWENESQDSIYFVTSPGAYTLYIGNSCQDILHTVDVDICEICEIYVPNAFSPNADGRNDRFRAYSDCELENYHMMIYDRWGGLVYDSTDAKTGWDGDLNGKSENMNVYLWILSFEVVEDGIRRGVELSGEVALVK